MNLNDFCAMAVGDCVNAGPDRVPASILPPVCERCEGRGEIEEACGRDQFGVYETDVWPCPDCHGTGDA